MIIVPQLNLRHIKMQKITFLKNPAVTDTWKITSKLSTHDTLVHTVEIHPLNDFFNQRASYHLKAYEFRNLQAYEFLIIDFYHCLLNFLVY